MGKLVRIIAHTRMKIYIDGAYYAKEDAKISVFDHGLLYGDGVFEGIRIYHSRVFKLKEHIERLYYSAKAILLTIPMTPEAMAEAVLDACRQNQLENGYIRLIVTRGAGSLGLSPNSCENPSVIIIANEIQLYPPELYEKGMEIITAATSRNFVNAINPAIKSLNYLNNILAKIEASHAGCEEAIMLNSDGFVAECTGDNLFIFHHGVLFTPPLAAGALHGITRNTVMELAQESGYTVQERNLTRYDLYIAQECFLTGSGAEIVPVVKIDQRVIGEGIPGKVTKELDQKYRTLTKVAGEPL